MSSRLLVRADLYPVQIGEEWSHEHLSSECTVPASFGGGCVPVRADVSEAAKACLFPALPHSDGCVGSLPEAAAHLKTVSMIALDC